MICFVTTRAHRYTHKRVGGWRGAPQVAVWSYDRLLAARSVPAATWIFTDFDRLGFWELELAARLWRVLQATGQRVLNDPARVRQRFALLRALKRAGINAFDAWSPASAEWPPPDAYPVFLRNQAAHRGAIGGLVADRPALQQRIEEALREGYPRQDLMIVQYAATPLDGALFRKLALFKVGAQTVPALCVHENDWQVKDGTHGIATPALYQEEYDIIAGNPHAERLLPAFAAGEIDYGRADFAFPDGRLAVYEINTNPAIGRPAKHPSPVRMAAFELWRTKYLAALNAIDTAPGGRRIALDSDLLKTQRRRDFPLVRTRWTA